MKGVQIVEPSFCLAFFVLRWRAMRMPTGEEAGAGQPICQSETGWHGAEWPFPSQRGGIEGCMMQKKEVGGPFRECLSLFLQGLFAAALF